MNWSIRTYLGVDLVRGYIYKEVKLGAPLCVKWRWLVAFKIVLKTVNFIQA